MTSGLMYVMAERDGFTICIIISFSISTQMPVHTIASNAGVEGAVVVGKLLEQDNPDLGYDAAKGLFVSIHFLPTTYC